MNEQEMLANHREKYQDFSAYCNKKRLISFWHQCDEIFQVGGTVLEVGVGSRVLKCLLENFGVDYKSLDIDPGNQPDYVGSVADMPFADNQFDTTCCFQVLEHLPFELFEKSLQELFRVSSKAVMISLPNAGDVFTCKIPRFLQILLEIPLTKPTIDPNNRDGHQWELNRKGYPLSRIMASIQNATPADWKLEKSYRVFENAYHHFFIFKKR